MQLQKSLNFNFFRMSIELMSIKWNESLDTSLIVLKYLVFNTLNNI